MNRPAVGGPASRGHGKTGLAVVLAVLTLILSATVFGACADSNLAESQQELSDLSVERVIPLRFIQMLPSSTAADNVPSANILWAVDRANRLYGQAGLQFSVYSIDRIVMPSFLDLKADGGVIEAWDPAGTATTVREQLQLALPNIPDDAWSSTQANYVERWLAYAAARFAPDDYAIVWIPPNADKSWGAPPWKGRSLVMTPRNLPEPMATPSLPSCGSGVAVATNNFSHELGHFLGLAHPFAIGGVHPRTGAPIKLSDYWDLVYCPEGCGTTNRFFDSAEAAAPYEASLTPIDQDYEDPNKQLWPANLSKCWDSCKVSGQACTKDTASSCCTGSCVNNKCAGGVRKAHSICANCPAGTASCQLPNPAGGFLTYATGHPGMKGTLFDYGPGVQQGTNVMAYVHDSEVGLSTSQKLQIRRVLRYDVPFSDSVQAALNLPPGTVATGRRHVLGTTSRREMGGKLDFDGDGRRDIAVWQPPLTMGPAQTTGRFLVLLSSQQYDPALMLVRDLGQNGDTPVPADYDGDGKTDFAVFHPAFEDSAHDWAYWRWCPSKPDHDCAPGNVRSKHWGIKNDIPLPGLDFDGDPKTGELAIFRRSIGRFAWYNLATGASDHRDVGGGRVPMPGLFDFGDDKTDLVTWDPINARYELRQSLYDYDHPTTYSFPNVKPSLHGGTASARASGVPVALKWLRDLRSLSVYDPEGPPDGTWNTIWFPSSSPVVTCDWGTAYDVPLGGYLDLNDDFMSDYVVYRAETDGKHSSFRILPDAYHCSGASRYVDVGVRNHAYPFIAADMDGDGTAELGLFEAAAGWTFFFSREEFAIPHAHPLGNRQAVPL